MTDRKIRQLLATLAALMLVALPMGATAQATAAPQASIAQAHVYAQAAKKTTITITKHPGKVGRGYTASVSIKTSPNAKCSMTVRYKSGPSTAKGVGAKTATTAGIATWSWKVGTNTTRGSWPVVITCNGVMASTVVTVP